MDDKIIIPGEAGVLTEFQIIDQDTFTVKRSQDVQYILDRNAHDRNDSSFNDGYTPGGDMKHVARIPVVILELWAQEAGIPKNEVMGRKMMEVIRAKLNDPDNEFLRTGKGKI